MSIDKYNYQENKKYYVEKEKSIFDKESWIHSSGFASLEKYMKTPTWIYTVNSALRTGVLPPFDPFILKDILLFDSLFEELPEYMKNDSPVQLYRGLVLPDDLGSIISGVSKTDIFTDKGFVITSSDREIASMYAQGENAVIMHITVPKGSNIIDSAKFPKTKCQILKNQKEVLLPRNAQFKITSYNPETKVVEATYLGQKYPLTTPARNFSSGADALSDLNKTLLNFQIKNDVY